jgi:hypothetical protein
MEFADIIELEVSSNALVIKKIEDEINSIIRIGDKDIEELKIKRDAILYFTCFENLKNPIKPEFTIFLYLLNNQNIELVFESEKENLLREFEEYIKLILI